MTEISPIAPLKFPKGLEGLNREIEAGTPRHFLFVLAISDWMFIEKLQTFLGFLLLLPLLVVVFQIQLSNFIEFHEHSLLSINTSVTTSVQRMIISLPCLFKYMKNDERVAMLFQCLLDDFVAEK